jgi:hypothetical protein
VYPSLLREWEDFTDSHEKTRKVSEEAIEQYCSLIKGTATEAPPLIIAGGLGSGKTQLLFHLFKQSFRYGVPALYVDLKSLVNILKSNITVGGLPSRLQPEEVLEIISNSALDKLMLIRDNFTNDWYRLDLFWLPGIEGHPNLGPQLFFAKIGLDHTEAYNCIKRAIQQKRGIVLLVDEVEVAYKEFKELLEGGFRGFVDLVGRGLSGVYVVMAVSYLSYYELFLSELTGDIAFARRIKLLQIPPTDPDTLYEKLKPLNMGDKSNTFWWLSRGRQGWIISLRDVVMVKDDDIGALLEWDKSPHLKTPMAENIPILDVDELRQYENRQFGDDSQSRAALRYFLLNIRPHYIDELPGFVRDKLDFISPALLQCKSLVGLRDVVSAFMDDITEFCRVQGLDATEGCQRLIERALSEILSGFAIRGRGQKWLCVGASSSLELNDITRRFITSILDIVTTYIAENYAMYEEYAKAVELLYLISSKMEEKDVWLRRATFNRLKGVFEGNIGQAYSEIGPWIITMFIPMYLSSPVVSKEPGVSVEQLEEGLRMSLRDLDAVRLIDAIEPISKFIIPTQSPDSILYFIPLPRPHYTVQDVKEKIHTVINEIVRRHHRELAYSPSRLFVYVAGADSKAIEEFRSRLRMEPLGGLLMDKLRRIAIEPIPTERLSDFIKSLFVMMVKEQARAPTVTIDSIVAGQLRADQRRRTEYFRVLLQSWVKDSIEEYNRLREQALNLSELTPLREGVTEILNTLVQATQRMARWRRHIKVHGTFFLSLPQDVRDLLKKMELSLLGGGTIKIESLPSVYQEFSRRGSISNIWEFLDSPTLHSICDIAIRDSIGKDLKGALTDLLDSDDTPLYGDFVDIMDKTFRVNRWRYGDQLHLLYKLLLTYMLLQGKKEDVLKMYDQYYEDVKKILRALNELLNELDKLCQDVNSISPTPIDVKLQSKSRPITLKDEVRGIEAMLDEVEHLVKGCRSERTDPKQFALIAFVTTFGMPEDGGVLLRQIKESLQEWYRKIDSNLYKPLNELLDALNKLPLKYLGGKKLQPIDLLIESPRDLEETAKRSLDDILKEVVSISGRYEDTRTELRNKLGNVASKLLLLQRCIEGLTS